MKLDIYSHDLTINFSDVDINNEISNKGILRLMQEVAGIHSGLLGYGVNDTPRTGLAWLILYWKLKVFSRPRTNTKLVLKTWTHSQNPLFSYRDFEVYDDSNNLIAIATSKWVLFDINKKSISKITEDIKEKYICLDKSVFEDKINEKLKEPENSEFVMDYIVQRRDIDTNRHVNNLCYLDYAYEALPEEVFENCKFSNVEIMYKHEAKLKSTVSLFYSHTDKDEHVVTIKDKKDNKLHAIVKLF